MTAGRGLPGRATAWAVGLVALALAASACSGTSSKVTLPKPAVIQAPTTTPTTVPAPDARCNPAQPEASFAPDGTTTGPSIDAIRKRGYLVAAVSADTLLFGFRNPQNGQLEGFDIDVAKQVAGALFNTPDPVRDGRIRFKVVNYAQRIPSLQDGSADLVADVMTINCKRWASINFSSQYFSAGQTFLVKKGSGINGLPGLAGKRVCAAAGSTNLDEMRKHPEVTTVPVADVSDCMVLFQQGTVDAVTGDNTVLAGFVQQDPYAVLVTDPPITSEPYGLGVKKENVDLTRFVNGVLAQMRSDGTWTRLYDQWLKPANGAPPPPPALYGR